MAGWKPNWNNPSCGDNMGQGQFGPHGQWSHHGHGGHHEHGGVHGHVDHHGPWGHHGQGSHHGQGYSFHPWNPTNPIPLKAVRAGHDIDGSPIYVGRAFHNGDHIPAKVIPTKSAAYISWDGKEIQVYSCEIMVEEYGFFTWIHSSQRSVPYNAIPIGHTNNGEPLYAGRVYHGGSLCVGKVHPSHGKCYIPFGGTEHAHSTYEVLCRQ